MEGNVLTKPGDDDWTGFFALFRVTIGQVLLNAEY
jgi:hypothetical protein